MRQIKATIKMTVIAMTGMSLGVSAQWNSNGNNSTTGKVLAKEYNFPLKPYDFSKKPRTQLSSMTIKLFDDYHSRRPGGSSPDNNNYGTLLSLNGYSSHWESNIYFGASTKKMYFRTSTWSGGTAENGVKGDFHGWRTLLDSKSDLKTNGNLKISGNGNHYISNGKLGIGTVSTGNHKLAVEGSIGAREIKVESNGWSDFVFYDNYNLPTLTEVENHIKQKGHLKDIPSAEEVEKNGIYLGEMDAKLLRKIEELTLYTIDQQKEIEELKKQNSRVKYLELLVNKLLKDNN